MKTTSCLPKELINVKALCYDSGLKVFIVDILSDCLPNFLFEFFEKYLESLTKAHQKELSNIKLDTKEHKGKEENLRKKLTEVEE